VKPLYGQVHQANRLVVLYKGFQVLPSFFFFFPTSAFASEDSKRHFQPLGSAVEDGSSPESDLTDKQAEDYYIFPDSAMNTPLGTVAAPYTS